MRDHKPLHHSPSAKIKQDIFRAMNLSAGEFFEIDLDEVMMKVAAYGEQSPVYEHAMNVYYAHLQHQFAEREDSLVISLDKTAGVMRLVKL